ncbi:MAG: hypothetical protein WCQ72_07575 [Eubacteriales bacterium]
MLTIGCARAELTGKAAEDRARLSLLCQTLLAKMLHERSPALFDPSSPPVICRTELGKPYFRDHPDIFFSFSHSGELAVCALGNAALGVDAERKRVISDGVRRRFLGGCAQPDAVKRWTERESYGKMTGEGFLFDENFIVPHEFAYYSAVSDVKNNIAEQKNKEKSSIRSGSQNDCPNGAFEGYMITLCISRAAGTIMTDTEPPHEITWY